MTEMGSLEFANPSPACSILQCVRYSMVDSPTVCLNFRAKVDRDMPARPANSCTVQRCAGSSCIEAIAALICLSARAKSHPTPPLNPSARCSRSLNQQHMGEVLSDQNAARPWLAQLLHHPLEAPT